MIKRVLLILAPILTVITIFNFLLSYFKPEIDHFLSGQIRSLTAANLPFEMTVSHVNLHFLPPSLELADVKIAPKNSNQFGFEIAEIDSIVGDLDILQLMVGQIAIQTLEVINGNIDIDLDGLLKSENKKTSSSVIHKNSPVDLKPVFDQLKTIPVKRLILTDLSSHIVSAQYKIDINIDNTQALLISGNKEIIFDIKSDLENFTYQNITNSAAVNAAFIIKLDSIEISKFHFNSNEVDLNFKGFIQDLPKIQVDPKINGQAQLKVNLNKISEKMKPLAKFPLLTGSLKLATELNYQNHQLQTGSLNLEAEKLGIDNFEIGNLQTALLWKQNTLSANHIQLTNESALIDIENLKIEMTKDGDKSLFSLKSRISTEMLDLHELLKLLKVGDVPVELFTQGQLDCSGPLYPSFSLRCEGAIEAEHLEVRASNTDKNSIVQIESFKTNGDVTIDSEKVQYHANINIGENKGSSEGIISYKNGFDISYATPELSFKNIKNLANLKIEGSAKLAGKTKGNSRTATFFIDSEGQDLWLENFHLGHAKFMLNYAKGKLSFNNIEGHINDSLYSANVEVDLNKEKILVTGSSPFINTEDALKVFSRRVALPFAITGTGTVKAQIEGPFDFSRLSYNFKANLSKPIVLGEIIDSVDFHVLSKEGEVAIQNLKIKKGHGEVDGTGVAHPNGQVELKFIGKNFYLEESDNIAKLGANISGRSNYNLSLNGHILHPRGEFTDHITELAIEDLDIPASSIHFTFDERGLQGQANLVGGKLKSDFIIPISDEYPFKFEASARDWNYTTLFTLLGGAPLLSEYQASLTGDISFKSDKGGIFNATGEGSILRAYLKRGDLELKNPGPMDIIINHGKMILKNFKVSGNNSYLELSTNGSTPKDLNFKLNGKFESHLLQVFLPFLEQLSGLTNLKVSIGGSLEKPEVFGNAEYEKGIIKLRDFPHAFEKINAVVQFSQTKVVISDVTATLAGGTIAGDGTITLNGIKNFPMLFRAHAENINLNIPDQMRTSGTADLTFSGNWFPFLLAGSYRVSGGKLTKEFGNDAGFGGAQQSSYLPKILLQSAFDPIRLSIQTVIEQPLQIKNSLVDGTVTGALLISGSPSQPILTGKVAMNRNSKVNFRDKSFEVTTANVTFNDPKEINPEIYLLAQSRVTTYDVNLNVQGFAKNPMIRLNSQPPLPEHDIISLLALGMTTANLEDRGAFQQKDQQQNLTAQLGAAVIQQISKDAQKALDVDFQITSQYDDTKNMSIQKYTLSRKFTDKVTASASVTRGDQASTAYQLKYSINPQVSVSTTIERMESTQTGITNQTQNNDQILGLDLEYKQEFK